MTTPDVEEAPRILLVRRGGFSHTNAQLFGAIRALLPGVEVDEIDLDALVPKASADFARCVLGGLREYGLGSLRSRALLRHRATRNVVAWRVLRQAALRAAGNRRYLFSLQTQSLFNAAAEGRPHYVYTDHAARLRDAAAWDDGMGETSPAWLALEASIYADAAHVFTFGSAVAASVTRDYGVPAERVSAVGAGATARPEAPPDDGIARYAARRILFVGVEWARKGGADLVEAFGRVRARLPDATLTIAGCAPEVSGPGIEVLGRLPVEEIAALFARASCFCMPSRLEPFGIVYVEALHFALPIVATSVGDVGDIVREGENGRRVPPADPAALADALTAVLEDPARCQAMGRRSLALAHGATWRHVAARILSRTPAAALCAAP